MSTVFARLLAAGTGLALAALGLWKIGLGCPTTLVATPSPRNEPEEVAIYNDDPRHLWNRLHWALWVRTGPDGREYGRDRLDPYLWNDTKYLLEGKAHERAIAVLDEFLADRGETLVNDPLKRAILQRDLWAVFDWTAQPGENTREAYVRRAPPPRRALQTRLARIIRRLALTADQIKALPDNHAAATASREFAERFDADHPERPFLPPDLFRKDGPWVEVEVDNGSAVTATRHVYDFGARSAFRVFLRLPEGRKATIAYFAKLRDVPWPWVLTRESNRPQLTLSPNLPQLPSGTQAALVRQMLLIDADGRLAATKVTESVQLRVFRAVSKPIPEKDRPLDAAPSDRDVFHEFSLRRVGLFAGETGGLRPLGQNDKDFHTQLLVHPHDEFEASTRDDRFPLLMGRPLPNCVGCHDRAGIYSFRSYTGGSYPRGRYYLPDLAECLEPDRQALLSATSKRERYDWGLLQGLWEDRTPK